MIFLVWMDNMDAPNWNDETNYIGLISDIMDVSEINWTLGIQHSYSDMLYPVPNRLIISHSVQESLSSSEENNELQLFHSLTRNVI